MTYRGRIKNGGVVLDEPVTLPDGTEVDIAPITADPEPPVDTECVFNLG